MSLIPGGRLGRYEITAPLGEGGMGEVYRARDTTLDREVAIKILPESVATDPERLMRFEREAKTLAALNHPHIAQIYGFEERALVMELVEGETLADRLSRGPLPLDEALAVARQIADGLEAAHDAGIIHRDLKPANVKVRRDGTVKVLDFGLAKAASGASVSQAAPLATSPLTITSPARLGPGFGEAGTQVGVILGTAAYMSPEQAKGKPVDKRADVWAFGCTLYEMLTGQRAFEGEDVTDTIVAVMSREPDWGALPPHVPPHVRLVLTRCLQKDVKRRTKDLGDVRIELDAPAAELLAPATATRRRRPAAHEAAAWVLVALLGVALALVAKGGWPGVTQSPSPAPVVSFDVPAPPGRQFGGRGSLALSPDGRMLAYILEEESGRASLWVRALDSPEPRQINISANIVNWATASPSWSPDGRQLLLTAGTSVGGMVRKVDLGGGPSMTLAEWGRSAIWGSAGVVIYTGRDLRLYRVAEGGGESMPITTLDTTAGEAAHFAIGFLPGGRRYLFVAQDRDRSRSTLYIGSIDDAARTRVTGLTARTAYAGGYLWSLDDGTLVAQAFDIASGRVTGDAKPVAETIASFAVSEGGTLATIRRNSSGRSLEWVDARGTHQVGPAGIFTGTNRPDVSPDGKRLAFVRRDASGNSDIWRLDLERNIPERLTSHPADEEAPVFSPDGRHVAFTSTRTGTGDLYRRAADGSGDDELLFESDTRKIATGFSPDGSLLLFNQSVPETGADVWALPLTGARTPVPVLVTPSLEGYASFSPDGKWIAYCSGEPGEGDQVYVSPYPANGSRTRLSTAFGSSPLWSTTGRAVLFGTPDGTVMRAELSFTQGIIRPSVPTPLVKAPSLFGHLSFALDRSAMRVLSPTPQNSNDSLTVTVNWPALLANR